jgi:hypothetical protein
LILMYVACPLAPRLVSRSWRPPSNPASCMGKAIATICCNRLSSVPLKCLCATDARHFVSALIVPCFESLEEYARSISLQYQCKTELLRHSKVVEFFEARIADLQQELAKFEQVKKFTLLPSAFPMEIGEITPTVWRWYSPDIHHINKGHPKVAIIYLTKTISWLLPYETSCC